MDESFKIYETLDKSEFISFRIDGSQIMLAQLLQLEYRKLKLMVYMSKGDDILDSDIYDFNMKVRFDLVYLDNINGLLNSI